MRQIIIFDFNRTLFDPEANRLITDAREVLRALRKRGFFLALLAQAAPARREIIRGLGLERYFEEIILTQDKNSRAIEDLVRRSGADPAQSYVVGDRVRKEIMFGNQCGLFTIWIRQGSFAGELPRRTEEVPRATVSRLKEVLDAIR